MINIEASFLSLIYLFLKSLLNRLFPVHEVDLISRSFKTLAFDIAISMSIPLALAGTDTSDCTPACTHSEGDGGGGGDARHAGF